MLRLRRAVGAALALFPVLLLFSCNNAYGIFDDIQGQTKQKGSDIFKKTTAYTVFRFNNSYFASTAKLYTRPVSGSSWSKVSVGGTSSYFLRSAVLCGSKVYALTGEDSSDVKLYSSSDGSSWTQMTSLPTYPLDTLFSANGELFAVSHRFDEDESTNSGTSYFSLYHYDTGSTSFVPVANLQSLTDSSIRGVVYDDTNSRYYFASEGSIYYTTDVTNTSSISTTLFATTSVTIWYLSYTGTASGTGKHLYITDTDGNLYRDDFSTSDDVNSTPLSVVAEVPYSGGYMLVVGTDTDSSSNAAEGYYEGTFGSFSRGNKNSIVAHSSSIFNSTVENFPVHCFFWDSATDDLFVCISPGTSSSTYYGLYKSHYNGSSWDGWEAQ